jgi:hypothetical protein
MSVLQTAHLGKMDMQQLCPEFCFRNNMENEA